jgi:SAM-dependent methyltransferase
VLKQDNKVDEGLMVLVIGGGSIGQGMTPLYDDPDLHIMSFDIYKSEYTQFVADAHKLPLPDDCFHCVIIQAVLEHVLSPQIVVGEITRVLKNNGIVYSETPFLQHVHEGAYDFTRFTDSGHRYLYRNYVEISSGVSAGAGTQMLWSIDYFFRSLFRSRKAGKTFKVLFFWVQYLDVFMPEKYSVDAASGVFFLGRKSNVKIQPKDIVKYYKGAQ